MKALRWALLAALISLGGAWTLARSLRPVREADPAMTMTSPAIPARELAARGRELYGLSCSQCHEDDAHGDEGPDLHDLPISNARIANVIRKGIKGEMTAFGKKYDAEQVAALVAYLRSLH